MFALLAFGSLFGFVGLLLAVPLAAVIGVLCRFALRQYLASNLYRGMPSALRRPRRDRRRRLSPCPKFPRPRQLAFDLPVDSRHGVEDFLVGASNEAAYGLIERWPAWPEARLRLTGPEGAGRPISPRSGRARPCLDDFRQGADEARCRISSRVRAGDRGLRSGATSAPCSI
jgi:hypothetical protein